MTLDWTQQTLNDGGVLHMARCAGDSDLAIKDALEGALEKAVALLDRNVRDDSRYLLCEWDANAATLQVVVTNDDKLVDAPEVVKCHLERLAGPVDEELVSFLLRDYLTTCTAFLGWSLLAAFHEGDRQRSRLL